MSDMKLTNEKMKTYSGEQTGFLKTGAQLEEFGKKQNTANEMLASNINELIKRVCALEDEQLKHREILKKIAAELTHTKRELDRVRLSDKLNTSAIERIDKALRLAEEGENISDE